MGVKLFVAGLPAEISEIELLEIFSNQVLVSELNIIKQGNKSLGYGFVVVQNQASADRAINVLNGKLIGNRKITVKMAEDKRPISKVV